MIKKPQLEPAIIIIFGITGDLAQRKLLPALYHLIKDNLLHEHTEIIGVSRRDISAKDLLDEAKLCVLEDDKICDPAALKRMEHALKIHKMNLDDSADYATLRKYLNNLETKHGMCMNRLYYLAIPPGAYLPVVARLGENGLNKSCQHGKAATRLLVEKPFGWDLPSARELVAETERHFAESQIFRIDHYLAKETVQNILTFRFTNPIFESIWDNQHIRQIDIIASETIGVEGRDSFYEQVGALRDFTQSHLLQLLAAVTMEKPNNLLDCKVIHAARLQLLEDIEPIPADRIATQAVRGQYAGYKEEVGSPNSSTETYAAIKLSINNPRWKGVPITITTGKALAKKCTAITLTFGGRKDVAHTNELVFTVQPKEEVSINLCVKRPGFDDQTQTAIMDFSYARSFDAHGHPDAYERVLADAVRGDRTLFAAGDEVIASWKILQPLLEQWGKTSADIQTYQPGSTGPKFLKSKR